MDSDSGGSTLQYLSDEVRSNFQIIWELKEIRKWTLQGEEELENFLEQHRRAMSASRERESQIRWKYHFCLLHLFLFSLTDFILNIIAKNHSKFETWFSGRVSQERLGRARGRGAIPKTDLWSRLSFVISSYMPVSLISSFDKYIFHNFWEHQKHL